MQESIWIVLASIILGIFIFLIIKKKTDLKISFLESSLFEMKALLQKKEEDILTLQSKLHEESNQKSRLEGFLNQYESLEQRLKVKEEALFQEMKVNNELSSMLAQTKTHLEEERKLFTQKVQVLEEAKQNFEKIFKSLSQDVLKENTTSFLQLAAARFEKYEESAKNQQLQRDQNLIHQLTPFKESIVQFDGLLREMEKGRQSAFSSVSEQIKNLSEMQHRLESETAKLSNSLKSTSIRGRWGEIQLKRVVELAGMIEYCDFEEQVYISKESGFIRPDLVVRLPNDKTIIVDAKAPLQSYLDAHEAQDEEERVQFLKTHSKHVRAHIQHLSSKSYSEGLKESAEFVILFLPGDPFFSAALQNDPSLIEYGVEKKVLLATPTTLIAILRSVAFGWRQEKLAEGAKVISELGGELYDRVSIMAGHMETLKKGLDSAVSGFNQTVGSFESRVVPTAKKLKDAGAAAKKDFTPLEVIEKQTRELTHIFES